MIKSQKVLPIIFIIIFFLKYVSNQTVYSCSSTASCGCSANSAVLTKIVGGETASTQTWGWAASLRYTSAGSHFCGGSIISSSHILTAAHCTIGIKSLSSVRVYVGSIYLSQTVQSRDISKIFIYSTYNSVTYINDISIIKLSSPLNLNQNGVDLVCLPNVSSTILQTQEYPTPNTNLIAIGWGYTYEGSGSVSSTLRQVTIQSVAATSSYCQQSGLASASVQFCAGTMPNGGKDTCQGDSGGPLLMFNSNNVWEQVGITSNGIGCARAGYPGIYTRVAAYQSWINAIINHGNQLYNFHYKIFIPIIFLLYF